MLILVMNLFLLCYVDMRPTIYRKMEPDDNRPAWRGR